MNEQDIFEVRQTDVEIQEIFDQVPKNTKAIEDINGKLPAEASPENPLADKEYVDGKVGAEKIRADGAEQTLQGNIDNETQVRQQADQTLDGKIASNTQAIASEQTRAEGAEQVLDGKIAAEKTRAEGAESSLQTAIGTEAQARQQADQMLDGKIAGNTQAIASEQTRAEGAEQVLDGKIAAEKTRAEGAESSLQTAIGTEAQTRQQADQTLDGKIAGNTQAIANEKTRAEGAEQVLQTAIDIINGKIPAQATTSNQLADKDFVNSSISNATADFVGAPGQSVLAQAFAVLFAAIDGLKAQLDNLGETKAVSIDFEEQPKLCGQPLVIEGDGAPVAPVVPTMVGQRYHDTTNKKVYEAFSVTNSVSDWVLIN